MFASFSLGLALIFQAPEIDPNRLDIGRRGTVSIEIGQIVDTRTGKVATIDDIVKAAEGKPFVFLGENHAKKAHQDMEAAVIEALAQHGRSVTVGMEMFQRPKQDILDKWSAGQLTQAEFLDQGDWKGQWGYPYEFYRPVLEEVRIRNLGLVGLNVPRDWVRVASRQGVGNLPTSAKIQLPAELYLGNKDHRRVFDALVGPHAMPGVSPDNMYSAQVLWDEGMSDTALKYIAIAPAKPNPVFVVVAGSGHVMYGQGINYRIERRRGGKGLTVVMMESDGPATVSRGIGDFVFLSKALPEAQK